MVVQIRVPWSIPNAGPSVTTFHLEGMAAGQETAVSNAIRDFFLNITDRLPTAVSVVAPTEAQFLNTATGVLESVVPLPGAWNATGLSSSSYAAGAGARITWNTAGIVAGRRVRGTTFLVPLSSSCFTTDGIITAASRTDISDAATAFRGALTAISLGTELCVYSRPAPGRPGTVHTVTSSSVPSMSATLRGRKA